MTRVSACLGLANETNHSVEADHQQMCKFEDSEDETYKTVCREIEDMREEAVSRYSDKAAATSSISAGTRADSCP